MARKTAPFAWLMAATLTVATGFGVSACTSLADAQTFGFGSHHAKCFIVLLDETGSDMSDWNAMREQASRIALGLNKGDAFVLIAINDRGGEADNIRVPLTTLQVVNSLSSAELKQKRTAIVQQVMSLTPKGRPKRTDITGAINLAQDVANKAQAIAKQSDQHTEMDIVLAFFSDMQQTPHMPTAKDFNVKGTAIHFPESTKGYCFYVAAPGKNGIQSTVAIWRPLLNSAGIAITDNDFNQQGTVIAAIEGITRRK